jgi:xylulokinase
MRARAWSTELAAAVGLRLEQLPELCEPGASLGALRAEVASMTGLPSGLPVLAGAGDGQAAGLGAGACSPERAYLNLGTAAVCGVQRSTYRTSRAYRTLYGLEPGAFVFESDLQGGTFLLRWLCDRLLRAPASESEGRPAAADGSAREPHDEAVRAALLDRLGAEAAALPPGAEGLFVVPYWNGVMDPYWDDDASGITVGWRGTHGPAHLYRAIIEGIAFEERLRVEGLEEAGSIEEVVVLGGGARSELWCQILADTMARPVVRAASAEATALGVAVLGAASLGHFPSVRAASSAMTRLAERFLPGPHAPRYERLYREVYREIYPRMRPVLARLAGLRAESATGLGGSTTTRGSGGGPVGTKTREEH